MRTVRLAASLLAANLGQLEQEVKRLRESFTIEVLEKVRVARAYRDKHHLQFAISLDGGVPDETIGPCVTAGANQVVIGGPIFTPKDASEATRLLRARANEVGAGG